MVATLAFALVAQTAQQGGSQLGAPYTVKPVLCLDGSMGHLTSVNHVLVQNAKTWNEWWAKIHGLKGPAWGEDEPPTVDFDRYDVALVSTGPGWNSYGVTFPEVVRGNGHVVVRYDHRSYQTAGPGGGGVRCNPWGIAVIDKLRSSRLFPNVTVTFEENVQSTIGQPPKWKAQAEITLPKDS